ncbi:MAG: hypothetical protein LBF26_02620 [Puniceicoccales bacterium]|jgi:hypothetical protein|nr:hypothetical protein [Puniceicoccales bacterium]
MNGKGDDVAREVADSWNEEAEKISAEERAGDPEALQKYMMLKILAQMAREGKIQESFTRALDKFTSMTAEELDGRVEEFQKEHDVDLIGELEKIVQFMTAGLQTQTPSETTADDLIRSMFAGR